MVFIYLGIGNIVYGSRLIYSSSETGLRVRVIIILLILVLNLFIDKTLLKLIHWKAHLCDKTIFGLWSLRSLINLAINE